MSQVQATRSSTVINLCNNMIGSSMLTLPWCLSKSGIIVGLGLHVISAVLSAVAMILIAASCHKTKSYTFRDLGKKTMGHTFGIVLEVFVLLYTTLSCVSILVLTGDFISGDNGAARSLCDKDDDGICNVFQSRMFIVFVAALLVAGPLSCLQHLHALRYLSMLSLVGVIYLVIFIPYDFAKRDVRPNIEYAIWGLGIFQVIPIFNETLLAQYNVPRYYYEMRNRTVKGFTQAILTATGICVIFYVIVAVFGYLSFGSNVNPDILTNYDGDYKAASVAKMMMTLVVLSTYPLAFNSVRVSAAELSRTYGNFKMDDKTHYFGMTLILVIITMVPGALITDVSRVTDYKGAILGAFVGYIFAALIYLHTFFPESFNTSFFHPFRSDDAEDDEEQSTRRLIEQEEEFKEEYRRKSWKRIAYILMLWALLTFIMGTITTTLDIVDQNK